MTSNENRVCVCDKRDECWYHIISLYIGSLFIRSSSFHLFAYQCHLLTRPLVTSCLYTLQRLPERFSQEGLWNYTVIHYSVILCSSCSHFFPPLSAVQSQDELTYHGLLCMRETGKDGSLGCLTLCNSLLEGPSPKERRRLLSKLHHFSLVF